MPLSVAAITSAPLMALVTLPRPPKRLVPPITAAAIEFSNKFPPPAELSTDGAPGSADPNPGDIGYYAPGNDFVLYYGDQSEFPGIVILGSMDETGSDTVGSIDGDVTVTVSRPE